MEKECPDSQLGSTVYKRHYHKPEKAFRRTTVQQHNRERKADSVPAKPLWLLHIPEIITMLECFEVPVVDRAVVERLFGLRRRRAIELLHSFGGYQAGRTFLIDRRRLIDELRRIAEGQEFQAESQRKERLESELDRFRRGREAARVRIPVEPDVFRQKVADLPAGVTLQPGHLHIEFSGAEDLLAKLYELAQAASNDFGRFQAAVEPAERKTA
jgi:hypothetical protein